MFSSGASAEGVTFVVDTTSDANLSLCTGAAADCSLRGALNDANGYAGSDEIDFSIPAATDPGCNAGTGVCTITPASALPTITDPVVIDGYTQPGASTNTNGVGMGLNTVVKIELNGTSAGALVDGLKITPGGTTVRGLVINRFGGDGIELTSIGSNVIEGNFIGTDVSGASDLGNGQKGVLISSVATNTIGGTLPGSRNLISGNGSGVGITGAGATGNLVQGNFIGTDIAGVADLGNAFEGVFINGAANNFIGVTPFGVGNTIAYNGSDGVFVASGTGNNILLNSIHDNGGLGIDLATNGVTANDTNDADTGANNEQNFPVLSWATVSDFGTTVQGWLHSTPGTYFTVAFYSGSACDPSGNGEGALYLGGYHNVTNSEGNLSFTRSALRDTEVGAFVTATATGDSGNGSTLFDTSEFSACATVLWDNSDGDTWMDSDGDGVADTDEPPCGGDPMDITPPLSRPERLDGVFAGVDDDGDTAVDEPLPGGAIGFDCDGDGYTGATEAFVFASTNVRDQDPCGNDGWAPDLVSDEPVSGNRLNVLDITTYITPVRRLNTRPPGGDYSARWDVVPGAAVTGGFWIDVLDLTQIVQLAPPMLGGVRQFQGPDCPWPP